LTRPHGFDHKVATPHFVNRKNPSDIARNDLAFIRALYPYTKQLILTIKAMTETRTLMLHTYVGTRLQREKLFLDQVLKKSCFAFGVHFSLPCKF
jgi:hypothetical protein